MSEELKGLLACAAVCFGLYLGLRWAFGPRTPDGDDPTISPRGPSAGEDPYGMYDYYRREEENQTTGVSAQKTATPREDRRNEIDYYG